MTYSERKTLEAWRNRNDLLMFSEIATRARIDRRGARRLTRNLVKGGYVEYVRRNNLSGYCATSLGLEALTRKSLLNTVPSNLTLETTL